MNRVVTVERTSDGRVEVRSPAVGVWTDPPSEGDLIASAGSCGRLTQLNSRVTLVLPAGISGRVVERASSKRATPVEFGQVLFRLAPLAAETDGMSSDGSEAGAGSASHGLEITAPGDGVFYRRPAPDAPAYVEVGQRISRGQTLGLVEVMKTFNPIVFEGEQGQVLEVRVEDGEEIRAGQVLIVLEP